MNYAVCVFVHVKIKDFNTNHEITSMVIILRGKIPNFTMERQKNSKYFHVNANCHGAKWLGFQERGQGAWNLCHVRSGLQCLWDRGQSTIKVYTSFPPVMRCSATYLFSASPC